MLQVLKSYNYFSKLLFVFLLTVFLSVLPGCGSDDEGDEVLNGTFFMTHIGGSNSLYNQINSINFDGKGGLESTIQYDSSGDPLETHTGSYSVSSDYILTFTGQDVVGVVSSGEDKFSIIDTNTAGVDADILLGISVKTSSGMSISSLNGDYVFLQIRRDDERTKTAIMNINFNGSGNISGTVVDDTDGGGQVLNGTYGVSDNGALEFSITGLTKEFQGHVSPDGNLVVLQDVEDPNDDEVLLMVGLKQTTGADESLLSGSYRLNMLLGGSDDSNWTTSIDATADGAGNLNATVIADSEGDTGTHSMTYTVDADGTMDITGSNDTGIVSSDGDMFILVNTKDDDNDVMLGIGIKN